MLTIKILGPGCANCQRLAWLVERAVGHLGIEAQIVKVTDYAEIMKYPILTTPGLVINEKLVAAGDAFRVPGIARRAVMRIVPCDAEGDFMSVCLAVDERAGLTKFLHYEGIAFGDVVGEEFRAGRGANSRHVEQVFDGDGDAAQRPVERGGGQRGLLGFECILRGDDGDVGVKRRVEAVDLGEAGFGEVLRRKRPAPQGVEGV